VTTDKIFYVSKDIVDYNVLYSLSENTSQKLFQIDNQSYLDNIFYDHSSDTLWYFLNGYINYYSLKNNSETSFYYIADLIPDEFKSFVSNGIFIDDNHVYVTHYASDIIINISSAPEKKIEDEAQDNAYTLKVLISEDDAVAFGEIQKIISSTYNINIEQIKYDSSSGENKIRLKLLANDSDFDLFCVSSKNIAHYSKNNAFYDLASSATIVQNFDSMFEGLYDLCVSNNILCGIPVSVNKMQNLWNCNSSLLETLNIDLPLKKITWQEFYDWANELKNRAADAGINDFVVYAQDGINIQLIEYMSNYMNYIDGTVLNHTTEYAEYLDLYFRMISEGLISDTTDNKNALFTSGGHFDYMTTSAVVYLSPVLTPETQYTVGVNLLSINPNSRHIEQAIEYLEYASSEETLNLRPSEYLLKDRSSYQFINNFGERVIYESSTNGHDVLSFLIKNSTRQYFNRDVFNEMNADITKIRNQEISTSDFALKLYDKALMIIEE
jgi:ABC-type glycerol-3-phosphate transport system substrate-binding protein